MGTSKLKEAFTADEIASSHQPRSRSQSVDMESLAASLPSPLDEEEDEEDEDDFLARELGEDWG